MVTTISVILGLYLVAECVTAINDTHKLKLSEWYIALTDIYTLKYFGTAFIGATFVIFATNVDFYTLAMGFVLSLWVMPRTEYRIVQWHMRIKMWATDKRSGVEDRRVSQ